MSLRVAVLGATGAVGREMLQRLGSSPLPIDSLTAYASSRSLDQTLMFRGEQVSPVLLSGMVPKFDLVLASAGADGVVRFFDLESGSSLREVLPFPLANASPEEN